MPGHGPAANECPRSSRSLWTEIGKTSSRLSFDLDPAPVKSTGLLHQSVGSPDHWTVTEGSILDDAFLKNLDSADIVYFWRVLHDTGSMWQALGKAASLVKGQGFLYIVLYLTTPTVC